MSDKIPASEAEIFFNRQEPGAFPTELVVAHRRRRLAERHTGAGDMSDGFSGSYGAMVSGWLAEPAQTPAGVFARLYLTILSVEQINSLVVALQELDRIEGQVWAGQMTATLEEWLRIRRA